MSTTKGNSCGPASSGFLVQLKRVRSSIPLEDGTLYTAAWRAKKTGKHEYPWLRREGPDGRKGRGYWVDVDCFNHIALMNGSKPLDLKEGGQR